MRFASAVFNRFVLPFCLLSAGFCPLRLDAQGFGPPVVIPTAVPPVSLYTNDLNGDGAPDLIYVESGATPTASKTHVMVQNGQGTFTETQVIATAGSSLAVGNLTNSGQIDIGWISWNQATGITLSVSEGLGNGRFSPPQTVHFIDTPLNEGQPLEFQYVVASPVPVVKGLTVGSNVVVAEDVLGNALFIAGFQTTQSGGLTGYLDQFKLTEAAGPVAVSFLKGNSLVGYVISGVGTANAEIVFGQATQSFYSFQDGIFSGTSGVQSILLNDFNGDGLTDMAVEDPSGQIQIFPGNGDGTFSTTSILGTASANSSNGDGGHLIGTDDVYSNGILDLLTYTPFGVSEELTSPPAGSYKLFGTDPTGTTNASSFLTTDFNRDGALDVAMNGPTGIVILYGIAPFQCPTSVAGTVTACPEPSQFEQAFTLTAVGLAPGTVTFSISPTESYQTPTTTLGSAVTVDGVATLAVSGMPILVTPAGGGAPQPAPIIPGKYNVTGLFVATNSGLTVELPGTHTILMATTKVTLTPDTALTLFYGQPVNPNYEVIQIATDTEVTDGLITVADNGVNIAACTMIANGLGCAYGEASELLDAGIHSFTVQFLGDHTNTPSISPAVVYTINPDITNVTSLTSSTNPAPLGTSVTFTATISGNYATPTGPVQFLDGTTVIGTGQLNGAGQASFTTSTLALGLHPITVVYKGTQDFLPTSSGILPQKIEPSPSAPAPSTVSIVSNISPSAPGETVTFVATVSVIGSPTPVQSGTITFFDGTTMIGVGAIDSLGQAQFLTSLLAVGSHPITASFPGQASGSGRSSSPPITGSVSAVLLQVVSPPIAPGPGFELTVTPSPISINAGHTGDLLVTVRAISGFAAPVTLSCANLPYEASCSFVTQTIPGGGGSTTLSLLTSAPHACSSPPNQPYGTAKVDMPSCGLRTVQATKRSSAGLRALELGGPMLAGLLLFWPARRRARGRGLLLAVAMLAGLAAVSGCGNCTNLGTYPGTYSVRVTGTASGGAGETQSATVVVKVLPA